MADKKDKVLRFGEAVSVKNQRNPGFYRYPEQFVHFVGKDNQISAYLTLGYLMSK
jgi:hypothetical protein